MRTLHDNRDGTWSLIMNSKRFGLIDVSSYQKRSIVVPNRVVFMGSDWEEMLPELEILTEGDNQRMKVRGYTDDKEIVDAVLWMLEEIDDGLAMEGDFDDDGHDTGG
jgi:hypothetical protein